MTISNINNSIISLINYTSNNIFNSRLRLEILNLLNHKNKSSILESYFTLLTSKEGSIFQNINKIFKIFDLTTNDIKLIDQLSYSFAKIYYASKINNYKNFFESQNSVYFFIFAYIITQLNYNQSKVEEKEKIICDFIIMLKNLNEGKNYDINLMKEAVNEIKKNREPIIVPIRPNNYDKNLFQVNLRRIKDNILTSYNAYFYSGIFIILNNKKEIKQIINLQLDKNIAYSLIPHMNKICFTSVDKKIVELNYTGYTIEFKKSLFFEIQIQNNLITNKIIQFFQEKKGINRIKDKQII
jgi:hypothetical protein